jgi:hypothetical protein
MPDITMCQGAGDPLCEKCCRKMATPDGEHQSWFTAPPWDGNCEYFIEIPAPLRASDQIDAVVSVFSSITRSEGDE